jgi:hypothetical protein
MVAPSMPCRTGSSTFRGPQASRRCGSSARIRTLLPHPASPRRAGAGLGDQRREVGTGGRRRRCEGRGTVWQTWRGVSKPLGGDSRLDWLIRRELPLRPGLLVDPSGVGAALPGRPLWRLRRSRRSGSLAWT